MIVLNESEFLVKIFLPNLMRRLETPKEAKLKIV